MRTEKRENFLSVVLDMANVPRASHGGQAVLKAPGLVLPLTAVSLSRSALMCSDPLEDGDHLT